MARLVTLHGLLLEGVDATDHLVSEHAQGPPIDGERVAFRQDNLWGKILWSTAESIGHAISRLLDFGQSEVCELQIALLIKQDILWLQVSVDDAVRVQVLQSQDDLSCIEARSILRKANLIAQMEEELAAIEEIRDEVQTLARLEGVVQLHDEGMGDLLHDVTLDLRVVHLVSPDDEVFLERLDSVDLPGVFLLCEVHLAKRAASDHLDKLEIFNFECCSGAAQQVVLGCRPVRGHVAIGRLVEITTTITIGVEWISAIVN